MRQRGRKSSANLAVVTLNPDAKRVQPPANLRKSEAALFRTIINSVPADHFVLSDTPLIVSYVQTTLMLTPKLKHNPAGWEKVIRAQMILARTLRLTPRSRHDPKTLTRKLTKQRPLSAYDDPRIMGEAQ